MKKIFNYALLAAALLVGVNVNAADVAQYNGQNYPSVEAAFAAATNGGTIKVIAQGVQVNQAASIVLNQKNVEWILDLNGHDLVYAPTNLQDNMQDASMFQLYKGILRVRNGNIINPLPVAAGKFYPVGKSNATLRCFFVCGDQLGDAEPIVEETPLSVYGTQLWIEEGVFVDCTNGKDAVEVYDYCGGGTTHYNAAFGVYVNIKGKMHGEKYGIQMSGQVSKTPKDIMTQFSITEENKDAAKKYNFPRYDVEKDAEIYANPTLTGDGGAGIYLGGFCLANIHGYVHGSSGVYVKNGIVNITDAVIASDYTGTYVSGGHNGSSTQGAGSAIVILSSNVSYGETDVTIGGDTKVTSEVGYAIEQDVTTGTGDNQSKINAVHIEGGTYEGGDKGGVIFDRGTVTGGKVNIEDGNFTDPDVTGYLGETGGATQTTVTDEDGNVTIVVSKPNTNTPKVEEENIAGQPNLEWTTAKEQTMASGKTTVGFFNMQKGSVTIKAGATFEITDKLIMGKDARIVVEPGATLISSGTNGIVAASVDNITIQTDELVGAGQFLFNPVVNSNKNTNATVQLIANSFTKSKTEYLAQRFSIPTHNALKKITATKSATDLTPVQVGFTQWNAAMKDWVVIGYINVPGASLNLSAMNVPFHYYQLQCNNVDKKTVISMSGEMVSNSNYTLKVVNGWNTFANSYSGKMDVTPMLQELINKQMSANVYKAAIAENDEWINFTTVNYLTMLVNEEKVELNPLEAFLIENPSEEIAQFVLNYQNMVWKPIMDPEAEAKAPRHNDFEAMAKINVMQNDQNFDAIYMIQDASFTADIENGYDAKKYMNEKVNFYVNGADMKQQTLATNVLEGTYLGFAAKEAGVYTLSFDKMAGNDLVLVDLVNGQEIDMVNGAQYNFIVEANYSNDYRFMVKNAAKAPTAMDKVDAKANATKVISGGQFRIVKEGRVFNAVGAEL